MMKHYQSIIKTICVCITSLFLYNCDNEVNPALAIDSRFIEEAKGFVISDTINKSFKMIDNYGITENFDYSSTYGSYWQLTKNNEGGSYETFNVHTHSQLYGYYFDYNLSSFVNISLLTLNVFYKGQYFSDCHYDFTNKRITHGDHPEPEVKFYDSMEIRGIVYGKIIEIDFSKTNSNPDKGFIMKMYYSGNIGLIKFIRKDGIFFERI